MLIPHSHSYVGYAYAPQGLRVFLTSTTQQIKCVASTRRSVGTSTLYL